MSPGAPPGRNAGTAGTAASTVSPPAPQHPHPVHNDHFRFRGSVPQARPVQAGPARPRFEWGGVRGGWFMRGDDQAGAGNARAHGLPGRSEDRFIRGPGAPSHQGWSAIAQRSEQRSVAVDRGGATNHLVVPRVPRDRDRPSREAEFGQAG